MKKKLFTILAILALTLTLATPVAYAKKDDNPGNHYAKAVGKPEDTGNHMHGKPETPGSSVIHLYLYEKDPDTWDIVEDGAWGKLTAIVHQDKFVFNGHALETGLEYSLVYYPDPWPGEGMLVLGEGTVNEDGDIHIMGDFDFTSIPNETDENEGAKIWLVLSGDITISDEATQESLATYHMSAWNPLEYLFENNLIL